MLMGHQEMCMLWKETAQVGMAMTTITMERMKIILLKVLEKSGSGIQKLSCGSTLPRSTRIRR